MHMLNLKQTIDSLNQDWNFSLEFRALMISCMYLLLQLNWVKEGNMHKVKEAEWKLQFIFITKWTMTIYFFMMISNNNIFSWNTYLIPCYSALLYFVLWIFEIADSLLFNLSFSIDDVFYSIDITSVAGKRPSAE